MQVYQLALLLGLPLVGIAGLIQFAESLLMRRFIRDLEQTAPSLADFLREGEASVFNLNKRQRAERWLAVGDYRQLTDPALAAQAARMNRMRRLRLALFVLAAIVFFAGMLIAGLTGQLAQLTEQHRLHRLGDEIAVKPLKQRIAVGGEHALAHGGRWAGRICARSGAAGRWPSRDVGLGRCLD